MSEDKTAKSPEPQCNASPTIRGLWNIGFVVYLVFAVIALAVPFIVAVVCGIYWGALAAFIVLCVWGGLMPCTCMSGGLICSMIAALICIDTLLLLVLAAGKFLLSLCT